VVFTILHIFAAVKQLMQYRRKVAYLLAALMITALASRAYLTHGSDYYESIWNTAQSASDNGAWVECNCPVCHAEDFIAVAVDYFDYNPIITTINHEFGVIATAKANCIVVTSSLRAPPCLS